jgi:hypothetical protein
MTTGVLLLAAMIFFSPIANADEKKRCITSAADAIFEALRPLSNSCSRIGPASARWTMNASAWNRLSRDEQQQLMDQVASKAAIQNARVTIHVYAASTKVGTIGPGRGGWKFRRT